MVTDGAVVSYAVSPYTMPPGAKVTNNQRITLEEKNVYNETHNDR